MAEMLQGFFGGNNANTPQGVAEQRRIAAALSGRQYDPSVPLSGLQSLAGGFVSSTLNNRAQEAEALGAEEAQRIIQTLGPSASQEQIINALSNPWVQTNPGASSVAQALLAQQMKAADPGSQMALALQQAQLDALRAPAADSYLNAGDGRIFNQRTGEWIVAPGGGGAAPELAELFDETTGLPYKAAWNPMTQTWDRQGGVKAPSGMSIQTNPDGTFSFAQGSGVGGAKALTEGQSKDTVYATRAQGALPTLDQFGAELMNPMSRAVEGDPTGLLRGQQSPEFQQAQQAGKEFLQAILRKDTGAAITPQETAEYGTVYLPIPGDTPEVLELKRVSRHRALEAIKAGLPPSAILAQEQALLNSSGAAAVQTAPMQPQMDSNVVNWSDL